MDSRWPHGGAVWVTTSVRPKATVLTVENTGEALALELVSTARRAVSAGHRTHTHRPRRRRFRPGDRQKHHPSS